MDVKRFLPLFDQYGKPYCNGAETRPWKLGPYLAEMLCMLAPPVDGALALVRLADRLRNSEGAVNLSGKEEALLRDALAVQQGRPAWLLALLQYLIWPKRMAESDRAIFDKHYSSPRPSQAVGGKQQQPGKRNG